MRGRTVKLAGITELAGITGLTRARVSALAKHPEAPEPVARLRMGPVYDEERMLAFIRADRKSGPRPMTPAPPTDLGLELAGGVEIAEATGLTPQRVSVDLRRPGAPRPLARLGMGPVYDAPKAEAFVRSLHSGTALPGGETGGPSSTAA